MARAERRAEVVWQGDLETGSGRASAGTGAFRDLAVSWPARTEKPDGKTSPEELIAAAHASCFSMALSNILAQGGNTPEQLTVEAVSAFEKVGDAFRLTTMALSVAGRVPGIDEDAFAEAAERAKEGCPVSNALKGNVEITVTSRLEG